MANEKKKKLALVRGDSLNPWEINLWKDLQDEFDIVAFCGRKNLYATDTIPFPIKQLPSSTDSFLKHTYAKYVQGRFNVMHGLEKELAEFDIVHAVEVCYYYTYQSIQAKKINPNLKVVASVSDNSFGRFEYNYWPGLRVPPRYWREKINHIVNTNIKEVDAFVPITDYSAEFLKFYGADPKKIQVLMSGVDMTPLSKEQTPEFAKLLKTVKNKQVYLMVNRLVKEKGIYDVLHAWNMYLKENPVENKLLVVIGRGKEQSNFTRLVNEWNLESHVIMVENLPNHEVRELYKIAHALILGSIPNSVWQEQFGYVLAEAIINDCPVISTLSGAIPEVVGNAGLLVPPLNPVALKNALKKFDDNGVYNTFKANCHNVKQKFSAVHYAETLRSLYHSL